MRGSSMLSTVLTRRWALKAGLIGAALLPLAGLVRRVFADDLGANPIETITHATGDWALRFLLLTLAVTPLRRLTGWNVLVSYRRALGLLAFFYASLHLLTYVALDYFFDWRAIVENIAERPYVTAGLTAFLCMLPLAVTSTRGWIRRLGGRRWSQLHRLVYLAGVAGVVHYWWLVKKDVRAPLLYAAVLALLLGARVVFRILDGAPAKARGAARETASAA
jgi:sulfoxide reductase heme-binding subunit YedZ